jgi:hypothetical protein
MVAAEVAHTSLIKRHGWGLSTASVQAQPEGWRDGQRKKKMTPRSGFEPEAEPRQGSMLDRYTIGAGLATGPGAPDKAHPIKKPSPVPGGLVRACPGPLGAAPRALQPARPTGACPRRGPVLQASLPRAPFPSSRCPMDVPLKVWLPAAVFLGIALVVLAHVALAR